MAYFWDQWEQIKFHAMYCFIGGVGGVVFFFLTSRRQLKFIALVKCGVVSGFTGLLGGVIAHHFSLGSDLELFTAGLSGFGGGFGLLCAIVLICRKFDINLDRLARDARDLQDVLDVVNQNVCMSGLDDKARKQMIQWMASCGFIEQAHIVPLIHGNHIVIEELVRAGKLTPHQAEFFRK